MKPIIFLVTCIFALTLVSTAYAVPTHKSNFESTYPAAVGSKIDSCLLCHTSASGGDRNSYGSAFSAAGHNFAAIESADSDADGFTNIQEITALTFPGNAADKPATPVEMVAVPNVVGMTVADATTALATGNLVLGQTTQASSDTVTAGQIISQSPAAGGQAAKGSEVNIIVSSGPAPAGGCAGCSGNKDAFSLLDIGKMLGDLFLGGLSLMTLQIMARKRF